MKANCDYYIEGSVDATELAEKYAQCVSECPYELPVHEDGSQVCKTCEELAGTQFKFWRGDESRI